MATVPTDRAPSIVELDTVVTVRAVTRTPSPSPSEAEALKTSSLKSINWKAILLKRRPWYIYVITIVIIVLTILIPVYRENIEEWLNPKTASIRNFPASWIFPILILFILSFPPLIGHELVALLIGFIWGLGIGFAIMAAGTILGEGANFYVFRYWLKGRARKLEESKISYACLAKVIREGGLKIALITRYSIIPGHISTILFSVCGINIFMFTIAVVLSLPKQLIFIYIGVLLRDEDIKDSDTENDKITLPVLFGASIIAFIAMWYLHTEMEKVKPSVIYERRKARQAAAMGSEAGTTVCLSTLESGRSQEFGAPQDIDLNDGQKAEVKRAEKSILPKVFLPSLPHLSRNGDSGLSSV